ncbi:MAG: GerMN domain-containing protein [Termitinemataceae bacterium]|nr:MAG: GerMN domain-containing protein [Termitinemataceae bacterium]
MAYRKNSSKKNKSSIPMGMLFWLVFFVVIAALFAVNFPLIKRTLGSTQLAEHIFTRDDLKDAEVLGNEDGNVTFSTNIQNGTTVENTGTVEVATEAEQDLSAQILGANTDAEKNAETTKTTDQNDKTLTGQNTDGIKISTPAAEKPQVKTNAQIVYLVKIDSTGMVFTQAVKRNVVSSDSPLLNTINSLLEGSGSAEEKQGLKSLIPKGTKLISARVSARTAILNFNENFMFNTFGAEGFAAQLRQIIWTATEFSTVDDVQILVEGQRKEYLGDSINISRPIDRNSL